MSEEEKRTKKQKIEDNRRLRALSQNLSNSSIRSSTPSSSPSIVPENEHFHYSVDYSMPLSDSFHCQSNLMSEINYDDSQRTSRMLDAFDYRAMMLDSDRRSLSKIDEHYCQAVRWNISEIKGYDYPCLRKLKNMTDLINEFTQISTIRMITFFKLTPEFNVRAVVRIDPIESLLCFSLVVT
jgi:hypothetical protein